MESTENQKKEATHQKLFDFIYNSATPIHLIENIKNKLIEQEYKELVENEEWGNSSPDKVFIVRGTGNLIAINKKDLSHGKIILTHSDIPCFKVSSKSFRKSAECETLNVNPYGQGLWFSWTDRDLRIGGEALIKNAETNAIERRTFFSDSVAVMPSLAVHLASGSGIKPSFKMPTNFYPIVALSKPRSKSQTQSPTLLNIIQNQCETTQEKIEKFNVFLIDSQRPARVGIDQEFIAAQGIDGPGTAYESVKSFLRAKDPESGLNCLAVLNESECLPSFLKELFTRIGAGDVFFMNSLLATVKGMPGRNPNFSSQSDSQNSVPLKGGLMYTWDSNMAYATDPSASAKVLNMAKQNSIPLNPNIVKLPDRTNKAPTLASSLGIPSIEIGLPILGVKSIREMAHFNDLKALSQFVKCFYECA